MELSETLSNMLSGNDRAGKQMAEYCQKMALAYLTYKQSNKDEILRRLAISKKQLAWDCIAELFERDKRDCYVAFREYFSDYNLDTISESELEMALRRLVFTKVNDGLFRNFGSVDPSLRKIIRNLKLGVKRNNDLLIKKSGNEKVLGLSTTDWDQNKLPSMPPEFLEIRLSAKVDDSMQIPEILEQLKKILQRQQVYLPCLALSQLAISIRRIFARMYDLEDQKTAAAGAVFLNGELEELIEDSIESRKEDFASSYLDSGKLTEELFNTYFETVKDILRDNFVEDDPRADTYFEHLEKYKPNLSKEDYRQNHRQYLEYFTKKTRSDLITELKKEYKYSAVANN